MYICCVFYLSLNQIYPPVAAVKRADAAESMQRLMQSDIEEARQIQGFNAQLHKDLGREQVARKRLHNEMEDMKGTCVYIYICVCISVSVGVF